jgi:hypothetical protein
MPICKVSCPISHAQTPCERDKQDRREGSRKEEYFIFYYLSTQNKAIPEISNWLELWQDVWDSIKAQGGKYIPNDKSQHNWVKNRVSRMLS